MSEVAVIQTVLMADRLVVKNGRSRAITIPNHIADALGMEIGNSVRIHVQSDGSLIIYPMETVHLAGGVTYKQPKRTMMERPSVIPIIPEGRTVRQRGEYLSPSDDERQTRRLGRSSA